MTNPLISPPPGPVDEPEMHRNLTLDAVRVTEAAAIEAARLMGKGDTHSVDEASTRASERVLETLGIRGRIVIGEGEETDVPMLYVGERVGRWRDEDPMIDIAIDPVEGAKLVATGLPNAISVIAMAKGGRLLEVPETYMYKIVVGPAGKGAIDMAKSPTWNLQALADAKGVYVEDLTVVILNRPRHEALIREVREAGARIRLIGDGDVSAAIATCINDTGVDMLIGTGGAAEGVIAAAAIRCVGGDMLAQIRPRNQEEAEKARLLGITDLDHVYGLEDLASGDVLLAATGITNGTLLRGVRFSRDRAESNSLVMRSATRTLRRIQSVHSFERKPDYEA